MKRPNNITGRGMSSGTKECKTARVNSSASILPRRRKLRESGFEKSSKALIGRSKATGATYLVKYFQRAALRPAKKYACDVISAKQEVVLISFVGAPSSPFGSSIKGSGSKAPLQFDPKTNIKIPATTESQLWLRVSDNERCDSKSEVRAKIADL